jgi:hypothetical protein
MVRYRHRRQGVYTQQTRTTPLQHADTVFGRPPAGWHGMHPPYPTGKQARSLARAAQQCFDSLKPPTKVECLRPNDAPLSNHPLAPERRKTAAATPHKKHKNAVATAAGTETNFTAASCAAADRVGPRCKGESQLLSQDLQGAAHQRTLKAECQPSRLHGRATCAGTRHCRAACMPSSTWCIITGAEQQTNLR